MARLFVLLGALNALLSVALGAFGAHALRGHLTADLLEVYHTAGHYQGIHALGLIAVGILALHAPSRWLNASGRLLFAGILLFCGSLYALALTGMRPLGMITPFGGVCFLLGWGALCTAAWRLKAAPSAIKE